MKINRIAGSKPAAFLMFPIVSFIHWGKDKPNSLEKQAMKQINSLAINKLLMTRYATH